MTSKLYSLQGELASAVGDETGLYFGLSEAFAFIVTPVFFTGKRGHKLKEAADTLVTNVHKNNVTELNYLPLTAENQFDSNHV